MIVTLVKSVEETPDRATYIDVTGYEFLDLFADEENCPSIECKTNADKLAGPGFILAEYRRGAKSKSLKELAPSSNTEVFCFDIDNMTAEEVLDALPIWEQYSCLIYSTYKHALDAPRIRLLVELDTPVSNYEKEPYTRLYLAAARLLRIRPDKHTKDRARLFFGPQHRPGIEPVRERYRGKPLSVSTLVLNSEDERTIIEGDYDTFDVSLERPSRQEIKNIIKRLKTSRNERREKVALGLEAILRGEAYAPQGGVHNATLNIAFELMWQLPRLDTEWFREEYLEKCWDVMPDKGDDREARRENWRKAVSSAVEKHEATRAEWAKKRAAAARFRADGDETPELTAEQLSVVESLRGKLVLSHKGAYFVFDARSGAYCGPYKGTEVAIAVRDCLGGVPGVEEFELTRGGPVLKSAVKLNHELGTTCNSAQFYAKRPERPWDEETQSMCCQAYKWVEWPAVYHPIADELLRAVSGVHYEQLEAYLTQFRNLDQPLPALTLVGGKNTWKSRICEILARFWSSRDASMYGDAEKVMDRFNDHLLVNPVIWSEEELAATYNGRPRPEAYRKSITGKAHQIEGKFLPLVTLKSAVRHVISVNDDSKVFSAEVDENSIYATMERFLLLYTSTSAVEKLEDEWRDTVEMDRLRSGETLLEHVRWLEENKTHASEGRLFVAPHTAAQVLLRARFSDDTLVYIWQLALDALERETGYSSKNQIKRLPLICDEEGQLRLSPGRVHELWGVSPITAGPSIKKPTTQRIGQILLKAGFKLNKHERASKNKYNGWAVNHDVLKSFIDVSDITTPETVAEWCLKICGRKPKCF